MRITIDSLAALPEVAQQFVDAIGTRRVFAFRGRMGAGKTTFIAEVCRRLGISETANSPSFAIINEYLPDGGDRPVYHFDFYRLESVAEAEEIGAEEYLYSGNLCLIEWPERVEEILPDDTVDVTIDVDDDGRRTIEFE